MGFCRSGEVKTVSEQINNTGSAFQVELTWKLPEAMTAPQCLRFKSFDSWEDFLIFNILKEAAA